MTEKQIEQMIVECTYKVHKKLGLGLSASAYENCLTAELNKAHMKVVKQYPLSMFYEDVYFEVSKQSGLLEDQKVVIDLKPVKEFDNIHLARLDTYLTLSGCQLGYLINFNAENIEDGIRIVNNVDELGLELKFKKPLRLKNKPQRALRNAKKIFNGAV